MATTQQIILNNDGSVKLTILSNYLVQGSTGVDKIELGVDTGDDLSGWTGTANFELPNGDTNTLSGSFSSAIEVQEGNLNTPYDGFVFTLTQAQTLYKGDVKVSLQLTDANENIRYSYACILTINPSVFTPSEQMISQAQWNSLQAALATYQKTYVFGNVKYYITKALAELDLLNLANGQLVGYYESGILHFAIKSTATSPATLQDVAISKAYTDENGDRISTTYFKKSGGTMTGDVSMGAHDISNVGTFNGIEVEVNRILSNSGDAISVDNDLDMQNEQKVINLPTPTASGDATPKAYVDTKIAEIDAKVSGAYVFKGSVASYADLPTNVVVSGWVYNTQDTGMNYASIYSNGTLTWDALGGSTIDLSAYLKKDNSGNYNVDGGDLEDIDKVYANTVNTEKIARADDEPIEIDNDIDFNGNDIENAENTETNNLYVVNVYGKNATSPAFTIEEGEQTVNFSENIKVAGSILSDSYVPYTETNGAYSMTFGANDELTLGKNSGETTSYFTVGCPTTFTGDITVNGAIKSDSVVKAMEAPTSETLTNDEVNAIIEGRFINGTFLTFVNPVLFPARGDRSSYTGLIIGVDSYGYAQEAIYTISRTTKVISKSSSFMIAKASAFELANVTKINNKQIPPYPASTGTFVLKSVDGVLTWVEE